MVGFHARPNVELAPLTSARGSAIPKKAADRATPSVHGFLPGTPGRAARYHRGLLIDSVKAGNMMLKLTLILVSSLPLASTEWGSQDGNMRRVPSSTLTTT